MALTARTAAGTRVSAVTLSAYDFDQLRRSGHNREPLFCPECRNRTHPRRHGTTGTAHFAHHRRTGGCRLAGESREHLELKEQLARVIDDQDGWRADLEDRRTLGDQVAVADVTAASERRDGDWAWEVQLAAQTEEVTVERHELRLRLWRRCVWVTNRPDRFGPLPVFGIDDHGDVIAGLFIEPEVPADPTPLDTVVERALARVLVWVDGLGWLPRGSWVAGRSTDRAGRNSGRSRAPHAVQAQLDWAWDRTTEWRAADWQGRARMAAARGAAGVPLDGIDEAALDRFPHLRPER